MNIYEEILNTIEKGESVALETKLRGSSGEIRDGLRKTLSAVSPKEDHKGRLCAAVTTECTEDGMTVCEPILPQERLLILGGGHIALHVADFAAKCGFSVIVADDRPDFANRARFPSAEQVICDSFENAIRSVKLTAYDYVVIITRGHRHDADCLRVLLPGPRTAYLGLIGSRRRVRGLMEMLAEEGHSTERMAEICTPIGLPIGAITPQEIAISILAELISYKRLAEHSRGSGRCCCDSDVELSTLRYLAENHDPKAIVTVIETKGSTPREAGAKMAVSPLGKVTGSIGGGCSEGAVIRDAVKLIGTGRYQLMDIDLTGDVAESDGMVCGGTMKVLIEDGTET